MPRIDGGGIVIGMGLIDQALEVYVYKTTIAGIDYYLAVRGQSVAGFAVISTSPNAHTTFNAALAYVGARGGGIVQVDVGTYNIIAPLVSTFNNVELQGFGQGTILDYDHAITTRLITFSGTDSIVSDLKIIVDTHLVPVGNPNVITLQGTDSEISNVTVDCSDKALVWVFSLEADSCSVVNSNIINVYGAACSAIQILNADDCTIAWNEIRYQSLTPGGGLNAAVVVQNGDHVVVFSNTITTLTDFGILLGHNDTNAKYAFVAENVIIPTAPLVGGGISTNFKADNCIIADNNIDSLNVGTFFGISVDGEQTIIADNRIFAKASVNAITVLGNSLYTTVSNNRILNGDVGISGGYGTYVGNSCFVGSWTIDWDGVGGDSGSNNYFASNYIRSPFGPPIIINNIACDSNVFDLNYVESTFKISDSGTNTIFHSQSYPFVNGTTLLSTDGSPYGWEVDAAGEFAITFGEMPHRLSVGSIVRMKVVGVGLVAPGVGKFIGLQITGRGALAQDSNDYATESIDLANIPSNISDSNVNGVLAWILTTSFSPSVSFSLKVQHEAAAGNNVETDAAFWHLVVEYV